MFSVFLHVATCVQSSFLFEAEWSSTGWTCHVVFARSPVGGQGHSPFLATVSNAAVTVGAQVCVQLHFPSSWAHTEASVFTTTLRRTRGELHIGFLDV